MTKYSQRIGIPKLLIFCWLISPALTRLLDIKTNLIISSAVRDFAQKINAEHIQLLFDANYADLVTKMQPVLFRASLATQTYNITAKIQREKYCNDTKQSMDFVRAVTSFVLCSPRRSAKFLKQLDGCEVSGRQILHVLLWRAWPKSSTQVISNLQNEAVRLVVFSQQSNAKFVVFANQVNSKNPQVLLPVNIWSPSRKMHHFPVLPSSNVVYQNLKGRTLKVPVLHKPPWFFVEKKNDKLVVRGGRDHQLLKELSIRMNFRYEYLDPPERTQGSSNMHNASAWGGGGVLALLQRREVDMFLGDAAVTYERTKGLDFSFFTLADSAAFVTHAPKPLSEALALVRPFQWQVWAIVTAVACLSGPVLYFVTSYPASRKEKGHLGTCIWISIAIFLKQSYPLPTRSSNSHKARLLIILFSVSATYVIGDLYCANLTSLLARPGKESPIRTLSELERAVSTGHYSLIVEQRSSVLDFLRNGTGEPRRLWLHMKNHQRRSIVSSVERGVALVRSNHGLALLAGRETLYFETLRFGLHHFHLSDPLYTRYSAIALQQGCPYLNTINSIVIRLFEAGVLDRMTSLEYSRLGHASEQAEIEQRQEDNTQAIEEQQPLKPLSVKMLQGAFIVLLAGCTISGLTLVAETAFYKKCAPRRPFAAKDGCFKKRRLKRQIWRTRKAIHDVFIQAIEIAHDEK